MEENLLLTIRCITYNHESYIRQCLEGFVIQKTNFKFEAIVHDDASTDGTADIIREYAKKYPNIIKPIFETENQYSKHDDSLRRILNAHMHGKYIAMCEGDDYWTDPYKLQKQVDFLESHPDYSLCFHNATEHWENAEKCDSLFVKGEENDRDYTGLEILKSWIIPTASVVYRKSILYSDLYKKTLKERRFAYGDIVLFLTNAELGKIRYLNETMSVYRRHENGLVFKFRYDLMIKLADHYRAILDVFGEKYKEFITPEMVSYLYFRTSLETRKRKNYKLCIRSMRNSFLYSPKGFIMALKEYLSMKLKK